MVIFPLHGLRSELIECIGSSVRFTSKIQDLIEWTGSPLYLTSPACTFYKCSVDWPLGSQQTVQWLNPTSGNVTILLNAVNHNNSYVLVNSTLATGGCFNVTSPCGASNVTIGTDWPLGNCECSSPLFDASLIILICRLHRGAELGQYRNGRL